MAIFAEKIEIGFIFFLMWTLFNLEAPKSDNSRQTKENVLGDVTENLFPDCRKERTNLWEEWKKKLKYDSLQFFRFPGDHLFIWSFWSFARLSFL
jgi:hypothetical protein